MVRVCDLAIFVGFATLVILGIELYQKFYVSGEKCEMTYTNPTYIPITERINNHTSYRLYRYTNEIEKTIGKMRQKSKTKICFVPALFVPGHAGSFRQVRSFGRRAFQMFIDEIQQLSLAEHNSQNLLCDVSLITFFAIDFCEEHSVFNGNLLWSQAEFVQQAQQIILKSYPPTTKIWLVGHSMGGIVSLASLTLPNSNIEQIESVITLDTPHLSPPAILSYDVHYFYSTIQYYLRDLEMQNTTFPSLVSISGGWKDLQVPPKLCNITKLKSTNTFFGETTFFDNIYLTTDHQAIVWCGQILKVLINTINQFETQLVKNETFADFFKKKVQNELFEEAEVQSYFFDFFRFFAVDILLLSVGMGFFEASIQYTLERSNSEDGTEPSKQKNYFISFLVWLIVTCLMALIPSQTSLSLQTNILPPTNFTDLAYILLSICIAYSVYKSILFSIKVSVICFRIFGTGKFSVYFSGKYLNKCKIFCLVVCLVCPPLSFLVYQLYSFGIMVTTLHSNKIAKLSPFIYITIFVLITETLRFVGFIEFLMSSPLGWVLLFFSSNLVSTFCVWYLWYHSSSPSITNQVNCEILLQPLFLSVSSGIIFGLIFRSPILYSLQFLLCFCGILTLISSCFSPKKFPFLFVLSSGFEKKN